ncbi:hypothetical protein K438DRAFT_1965270 [Mycena galopus ATCC 62051]|nr:hypothetical protein K438DRAFT_1965270 [Mycena galopus ATCC 62051]
MSTKKTKRRSLEYCAVGACIGLTFAVLPRPPVVVIPPIESQCHVRPRPQPSAQIPVRDPEVEASWTEFTNNIVHASNAIEDADNSAGTVDPAAEKERVGEEAERARVWDVVVELAVELMREPERREWLRDQRMEDDLQQMSMRVAIDWTGAAEYRMLPSTTISMDPPPTDLHRGERYMSCFYTPSFYTPSFHVDARAIYGETSERGWAEPNWLVEARRELHKLLLVRKHLHKHQSKDVRGMREHNRFRVRMLLLNEQIERVARGFCVDDEGDIIPPLENEYSPSLLAKL